jgi:hypothetical protein
MSFPGMLKRNWGRVVFISSESGLVTPGGSITGLQIEDSFEKASGDFKVGRAQRDMIEVHGGHHAMMP